MTTFRSNGIRARAARALPLAALAVMVVTLFGAVAAPASPQGESWPASSQAGGGGEVRLPLERFEALAASARGAVGEAPPPVGYALSTATLEVTVPAAAGEPATVRAVVTVDVLDAAWVAVPLLPAGTALRSARSGGHPLALTASGGHLVWTTDREGRHEVELVYAAPLTVAAAGRGATLPAPPATGLVLHASLPGEGLAVSVIPADGVSLRSADGATLVRADIPGAEHVRIEWGPPGGAPGLVLEARYEGALGGATMKWRAEMDVLVAGGGALSLPVLENGVALAGATVDGAPAVVEERDGRLNVRLEGAGRHTATLDFETPLRQGEGPSSVRLWLPRPPRARFTITLPGDKTPSVSPASGLDVRRSDGRTIATVNVPPTDEVTFTWIEALPDSAEAVRASAEVYHLVQAEEGVLQVRALVALEVARGATSTVEAVLPPGVIVNRVAGDGIVDWRVTEADDRGGLLSVYLDRARSGELAYEVAYEVLVGRSAVGGGPVAVPLLAPQAVDRHRGMVALLAGAELEMTPGAAEGMTKVGENQLPPWVRERAEETVAHTYKFAGPEARLGVALAPPARERGRFDVAVDTLVSVGDGVLRASATLAVNVKSGRLMELVIALPPGVNVLGVTAPSLRDHEVAGEEADAGGTLSLMFTQEMEGTLRVEVVYELLLPSGQDRVTVPALHVPAADMEQGRLAVEALTAVEIRPAEVARALPVDVQDLPRQLTHRTTNPILLAYSYVHAEPPLRLVLDVRRHAESTVQIATIDDAHYESLFTRQGLSLTRVTYRMRNRRKQFLSVALPAGSDLWSAALMGQPVKAAVGEGEGVVLVPLVNSAASFVVEIVYATPTSPLGTAGWLSGELPVPDIVETRSTWDVFLPEDLAYGRVETNMRRLDVGPLPGGDRSADTQDGTSDAPGESWAGERVTFEGADRSAQTAVAAEAARGVLPLRIDVPRRGVHLRFERLFTNRGEERARISVHYATPTVRLWGGVLLALVFAALVGFVVRAHRATRRGGRRAGRRVIGSAGVAAAAVAVVCVVVLGASPWWGLAGAGLAAATVAAVSAITRRLAA